MEDTAKATDALMEDTAKATDARSERYAQELAKLLRHETISVRGQADTGKFHAFHDLLRETFPHLFAAAEYEDFDGSFVLRWPGADPALEPVLFMNHHDVVEAAGAWQHLPFAGDIADGKVWGRGALDNKGGLWGMLRAADELAAEGFVPTGDIWFESACTEEIDGDGCKRIVDALAARGIRFAWSLDEGGMMLFDPLGGAKATFAMVGVGEKSVVTCKFIARGKGGHASVPGKDTPLVRLGRFMAEVEAHQPFRVELSPVIIRMFEVMAPTVSGPLGAVYARAKAFAPLLARVMPSVSDTAAALLRTTIAFTMAGGAEGYNVLPAEAWVVGNMRCSHHQPSDVSIEVISRVAKRFDLEVEILEHDIDSPVTDFTGAPFALIEQAVTATFPGVITAPYLMTGCSDSRFVAKICDHCLRFTPFTISHEQMNTIHGIDECVDASCLAPAVDFYRYLMQNR